MEINRLQEILTAVSPGNQEWDESAWRWFADIVFSVRSAYWHLIDGGVVWPTVKQFGHQNTH